MQGVGHLAEARAEQSHWQVSEHVGHGILAVVLIDVLCLDPHLFRVPKLDRAAMNFAALQYERAVRELGEGRGREGRGGEGERATMRLNRQPLNAVSRNDAVRWSLLLR